MVESVVVRGVRHAVRVGGILVGGGVLVGALRVHESLVGLESVVASAPHLRLLRHCARGAEEEEREARAHVPRPKGRGTTRRGYWARNL